VLSVVRVLKKLNIYLNQVVSIYCYGNVLAWHSTVYNEYTARYDATTIVGAIIMNRLSKARSRFHITDKLFYLSTVFINILLTSYK